MGMTQTLLVVVLFVAALSALPWLIRRLQQRQLGLLPGAAGAASRVLSAVAVGPQQRVVTVEVGPAHRRTVLVLGVTAQQVSCLHVLPATDFAGEMAAAREAQEPAHHG
ncbi:flagellar protein FliO/FliZ [Melaminivora alkalimesophila]|uniref:Flagellar protein FliO/FliZ n=2 Tax=Melaminivora alkalimesophila TaxID=1165852 RepID=A0A317R8P7_9BURK|nr:flagellar protein FliO/FliZ [Melaminivora alkalimesophila]